MRGKSRWTDYSLPAQHPDSFELDELVPVSKYEQGGYPSPTACALDYRNVDAAHRCCNEWRGNEWRGNRSAQWVLAQAREQAGRENAPERRADGKTSRREWSIDPRGKGRGAKAAGGQAWGGGMPSPPWEARPSCTGPIYTQGSFHRAMVETMRRPAWLRRMRLQRSEA